VNLEHQRQVQLNVHPDSYFVIHSKGLWPEGGRPCGIPLQSVEGHETNFANDQQKGFVSLLV
jgi:hypothetical protein